MIRIQQKRFVGFIALTVLLCVATLALSARISSVNSEVAEDLSPAKSPGVWMLNTQQIESLPWSMPETAGMTPGYYDGVDVVDIGELRIEDFGTFTSHADLPADYLEFDHKGSVAYALLPLTLKNNSDDDVLIQFPDFWLFCGIVPGSCAQALLPQFNQDTPLTLAPGKETQFTVVYRILRSGFSSDSEWNRLEERGFQLIISAYPDKYVYNLEIE